MNARIRNALLALAVGAAGSAASAQSRQVVFFEDFEGVALGPNVEEGIITGNGGPQDQVWSQDWAGLGFGFFFSLPGDGVLEWQGWSIADGAWWQFAVGDQARSDFTVDAGAFGRGAVMVADPDEWDDANRIDTNPTGFSTYVDTPAISLAGATPGTMEFSFFSSWRDEDSQTAIVEVSFDGGPFEEVLRWSSDSSLDPVGGPDDQIGFKNDAPNETVTVNIDNPAGAQNAVIRISLIDAGNDWWWALDDLTVTVVTTEGSSFAPANHFVSAETFQDTGTPSLIFEDQTASATDFTIQFSTSADFSDVFFEDTATSSPYVAPGGAVLNGIYYVRAIANNDIGSRPSFNSVRTIVDNPDIADADADGSRTVDDLTVFKNLFDN